MYQLYDDIPFGVIIFREKDLHIQYINYNFVNMFDVDSEFVGRSLEDLKIFRKIKGAIENCVNFGVNKKLKQVEILINRYFDIMINIKNDTITIFVYEVSQYVNIQNELKHSNENFLCMCSELKTKYDILQTLRNRENDCFIHLKNVLNNISEGIIVYDEFGKFYFCNKASMCLVGDDIKKFDVRGFFNKLGCYDFESRGKDLQKLYHDFKYNNRPIREFIIKLKDNNNNNRYIELNSSSILNEKCVINTVITLKDITSIKSKGIKLQEQREFINDVVNTIDVPIAVVEYDNLNYKLANSKYKDMLFLNNNISDDRVTEPFILDVIHNIFNKDIHKREHVLAPYVIKDKNGNERYYKIKFTGKVIEKSKINKLNKIFIHATDITEEIVHNKELQNISKMKDEFFNMISHELRTPLTIINSSVQLARDIYKEEITRNIGRVLLRVDQNCRRLLKLINNILDISKAEAGFLQLQYSDFDIVVVTENIVSSVSIYAKSRGIQLIFDTNEEEKLVALDKDKYEKIILNLLSNAIKFTPKGRKIYVTTIVDNNKVKIKVKDQGIGIEEENLKTIFDRFIQIRNNTTNCVQGTGLGLALVKNLVELMGGNIKVNSKINEGTEFTITFDDLKSNNNLINPSFDLNGDIKNKLVLEFSDIK
ncbi:HAMP domain-containing histidine kinase [Clostridium botulinum D/C]|uniref:PAS domain-containing sensor histidine kinase n=1 Tax=Clostridium botulinum TaxID=1491 RepID=UPI001E3F709D|nr:HAMP domain-containing sensor histidine kinase [Clostridium botulinum]MCD3349506.1 HAMP domain-containing histidine kinase [Clostridium botulinum D/C]MCD3358503.1 HAMP domain-containing histidine kinase [Clostridium botulinum D/C]MCD3361935.1 HAMP domain-containing histidine kinase [Clostridium botulinum D/C]MCD3364308.1 HAMP domain-containing histidine kinase [Clostridium botulinum D/C]